MSPAVSPPPANRVPRRAHLAYRWVTGKVRSNAAIHRALFGYWPAAAPQGGQLWDWTTLALRAALNRFGCPGASLLDMGTGPVGVLAIYAKSVLRFSAVCGADHLPELVRMARMSAAACSVAIEFQESSLFSRIDGRYDLIAFNSPYIATGTGEHLRTFRDEVEQRRWSGGQDGLDTIREFLAGAPRHLSDRGLVLLGVNHFYLTEEALRQAILQAGLEETATVRHRLTLACVHVLRPVS